MPDARHAVRDDDVRQPGAVIECTLSDGRNSVRNGHARQRGAVCKRIRIDLILRYRCAVAGGKGVRQHELFFRSAVPEQIALASVIEKTVTVRRVGQPRASFLRINILCIVSGITVFAAPRGERYIALVIYFCEFIAELERGKPYEFYAAADRCFRQLVAIAERARSDLRNAVRDGHVGQGGALFKRSIPDVRNAVRNGHARQGGAIHESARRDILYAVRNDKICDKFAAVI